MKYRYYYTAITGEIVQRSDISIPALQTKPPLNCEYIDSDSKYSSMQFKILNGEFVPRTAEPTAAVEWQQRRKSGYDKESHQLGLLYDDIAAGHFGEAAKSGAWFTHITSVKQRVPKQ